MMRVTIYTIMLTPSCVDGEAQVSSMEYVAGVLNFDRCQRLLSAGIVRAHMARIVQPAHTALKLTAEKGQQFRVYASGGAK